MRLSIDTRMAIPKKFFIFESFARSTTCPLRKHPFEIHP